MKGSVSDIHSAGESNHYAQIPQVLVKTAKHIAIGNILAHYGNLDMDDLVSLSNISSQQVLLTRSQKLCSLRKGEKAADVFLIKKGWVSLCHPSGNRRQEVLNVYMPGDIVGLRESFFDNHDITICALQNSQIERFSRNDMHALFNERENIKRAIISYVIANDNITIERLRSCTHHKAEGRVAHFLLEIFARYNFKGMIESNVYAFPITQEVVGELLGITSVHVSRCMTSLEQKKMIRKSRNIITLLQPQQMAEYTGFDENLMYGYQRAI